LRCPRRRRRHGRRRRGAGGRAPRLRTCLVEETDWLGGQLSAQGVSALDEHEHIESVGGTASYYALREALRGPLSAGAGRRRQAPRLQSGRLLGDAPRLRAGGRRQGDAGPARTAARQRPATLFLRSKTSPSRPMRTASARWSPSTSTRPPDPLPCRNGDRRHRARRSPAAGGAEYRVGAEAIGQTGEAHAQPHEAKAHCVQSFTYTFAAERRPEGERHVIPSRRDTGTTAKRSRISLTIDVHGGEIYGEESGRLAYRLYDRLPGTKGGLWTYRRLLSAETSARARRTT
jgi:hypothetical protein